MPFTSAVEAPAFPPETVAIIAIVVPLWPLLWPLLLNSFESSLELLHLLQDLLEWVLSFCAGHWSNCRGQFTVLGLHL